MLSGPGERENTLKVPDYPDLAGKVAVVTGGSGGIGAATCRLLAANGAKVAVNGRDEAKIAVVVDAVRSAGGEALGVAADCTDLAAVDRMRRRVEEEFGPAEVVAAFAGGGRARPGPVAQTTDSGLHAG
jgi:3-oxoacyl-[acyl-carrier protein] reductase